MAQEDPALVPDVLFGVWMCLHLEHLDGELPKDRGPHSAQDRF